MTSDIAVSARGLGKMYMLYRQPVDRLKQSLLGRFGRTYGHTFWALRGIDFDIRRGQVLGLIGRNGSGKSTLLQILAGTLQPTEGSFSVQGRLTALLELGAGFNPEFTGRENISLNGATMGIPAAEMREREGSIIDFAQIGEFIDQPVKTYSSGMFVRLAFAIATSLDPDVLLVDEALAVGDAGFVIRCINRMNEMRARGATIILVTHDIQTVRSFCDTAIWLHQGRIQATGSPLDISGRYAQFLFAGLADKNELPEMSTIDYRLPGHSPEPQRRLMPLSERSGLVRWGSSELLIESCLINDGGDSQKWLLEYGTPLHIEMKARAVGDVPSTKIGFGFGLRNNKGLDVITSTTYEMGQVIPPLRSGQSVHLTFDLTNILAPGEYALVLNAENRDQASPHYYDYIENAVIIKVMSERKIYSLVLPEVRQQVQIGA